MLDTDIEKIKRKFVDSDLRPIQDHIGIKAGKSFLEKYIQNFRRTGSPIVINLDHNVSGSDIKVADVICRDMEKIVKATASHVCGYKMNFQSMLTFLISSRLDFVSELKELYGDQTEKEFDVRLEPLVWLDQKLSDIPNTNYQSADILFKLGFDALHALPHIGPDSAAAVQLAASNHGNKGVIYVVNMTHEGYHNYTKKRLLRGKDGEVALKELRELVISDKTILVQLGRKTQKVRNSVLGTIEPANRPFDIFRSQEEIYQRRCMIISIGIGTQGALPGSALYAGATMEGIGRFIYLNRDGIDTIKKMNVKAGLSKECALLALKARYEKRPYPTKEIMYRLRKFHPWVDKKTESDLARVFHKLTEGGIGSE